MICQNTECGKEFEKSTHNQVYCCAECCRIATNRRIKQKYHENKARLSGKSRYCSCGQKLSRYNTGDMCSTCEAKLIVQTREEIKRYLGVAIVAEKAPHYPLYGD